VVLGLGPGTRDTAPLNPRPPPFRVEKFSRVNAPRFFTSPRQLLQTPLAGLPLAPSARRRGMLYVRLTSYTTLSVSAVRLPARWHPDLGTPAFL
jgi:hypothetical protein